MATKQAHRPVTEDPRVDVVGTLDKRTIPGILPAVVIIAGTVMLHGLNLAFPFTDQFGIIWALAVVVATLCIVFGVRSWSRLRQLDVAIDAILPLLAPNRPTRELVRASGWTGWIGVPGRVRIAYAPPTEDLDLNRGIQKICQKFSFRMGETYRIEKHNPRRCTITLVLDTSVPEKPDPDVAKATDVLTSILPGVTTQKVERDDAGNVELIEFTWPTTATERAGRPYTQARILKAIRDAFNDDTLVVGFDMGSALARVTPITPLPDAIDHPPRDPDNPMKVTFGQFRDGTPCVWDLDSPIPHLLIVGGTGGGKTVLLLSILTALPIDRPAQADDQNGGVEIWPIDPKRLGLFNLDLIPGARRSATREERIVDYILAVRDRMDARYAYLEENGPQLRETLDPLFLVIDEGEEMYELLTAWWKSGEGKEDWKGRFDLDKPPTGTTHPVMNALGSILRLGREARVHVILASQQAASTWISTSSRSQFAVRIALRNLEGPTSMMTFGTPIATSGLENKPGRAWVSVGNGMVPEHAQIYWTPKLAPGLSDNDRAILHRLGITLPDDDEHPATLDNPALAPVPPATETEPSDPHDEPRSPRPKLSLVPSTLEVPVAELEVGASILVDIDGQGTGATVEAVDNDLEEVDYLVVTYTTDDGEAATMSLPESETVTVTV